MKLEFERLYSVICTFGFWILICFKCNFSTDAHYAAVRADLESDAQDLEAESWSSAVDQQYVKKHCKETMKRQDVIYGKWDFLGGERVHCLEG